MESESAGSFLPTLSIWNLSPTTIMFFFQPAALILLMDEILHHLGALNYGNF